MPVQTRKALISDLESISGIYNQGISDRIATFESEHKTAKELEPWLSSCFPVVVAVDNGEVVAFAASFPYSSRLCYKGIGEFSVYVLRSRRGEGIGTTVMNSLILESEKAGIWKLLSKVFVENLASRKMLIKIGFREVGTHQSHAKLDGVWRDVVVVEYLITNNLH
ncbi:MAG: arsinothricin resistance N-acetyltransferase ArsN1 [Candidatus Thermoplasmatota archaeon]|nr:arsinothricin resistance N-acetyltransferase ArsN1 [Candidatus Thermoplasmatota archaeon]